MIILNDGIGSGLTDLAVINEYLVGWKEIPVIGYTACVKQVLRLDGQRSAWRW